jgi:hypothetical protein
MLRLRLTSIFDSALMTRRSLLWLAFTLALLSGCARQSVEPSQLWGKRTLAEEKAVRNAEQTYQRALEAAVAALDDGKKPAHAVAKAALARVDGELRTLTRLQLKSIADASPRGAAVVARRMSYLPSEGDIAEAEQKVLERRRTWVE